MDASIGDEQADWLLTIEKTRKWNMGSKDSALTIASFATTFKMFSRDKAHIREVRWTR